MIIIFSSNKQNMESAIEIQKHQDRMEDMRIAYETTDKLDIYRLISINLIELDRALLQRKIDDLSAEFECVQESEFKKTVNESKGISEKNICFLVLLVLFLIAALLFVYLRMYPEEEQEDEEYEEYEYEEEEEEEVKTNLFIFPMQIKIKR